MAINYTYIFFVILGLSIPSSVFCKKNKLTFEDKIAISAFCCETFLSNIIGKNWHKKNESKDNSKSSATPASSKI